MLWFSCKTETVDKTLVGPNYLPLEVGKYITYVCTEINHNAFLETSDTSHLWIKESCIQGSQDSNRVIFHCKLEQSFDSGKSWKFQKWIIYHVSDFNILRQEDDMLKSKIIFPLVERKTWDANSYNSQDFQRAKALEVGELYQSTDHIFSNTARIELNQNENLYFTKNEEEIYASGIGLIERRFQELEKQPGKYLKGNEYVKIFQESNW